MSFQFSPAYGLPDVVHITPPATTDHRGSFSGLWQRDLFSEALGADCSVAAGLSRSKSGVLRGMHFQMGLHKIVRCIHGSVIDVVVDIRSGSPSFGRNSRVRLSDQGGALFVPDGFAHGFYVLHGEPTVLYQFSAAREPSLEGFIHPLDPELDIAWWPFMLEEPGAPIMSERDASAMSWSEYRDKPAYDASWWTDHRDWFEMQRTKRRPR